MRDYMTKYCMEDWSTESMDKMEKINESMTALYSSMINDKTQDQTS